MLAQGLSQAGIGLPVLLYFYTVPPMNPLLQALLARPDVWQASHPRPSDPEPTGATVLPSGHASLDAVLYRGGWPRAALTELLGSTWGIGEIQLLAPLLARCSSGTRRLFFLDPPHLPYAPALFTHGIRLEAALLVQSGSGNDALWCAEQILRSGAASCLLAWLPEARLANYATLRRLQLAAQAGDVAAFMFRPPRAAREPSPAALRITLRAAGAHLELAILKQRGGRSGQQLVLARDAALLQ